MRYVTLPETNIAPENRPLEVWRFLLETTIFGVYVSFRECSSQDGTFLKQHRDSSFFFLPVLHHTEGHRPCGLGDAVFSSTRKSVSTFFNHLLAGGWTNPTWKICSSNWIISPGRGENKKYVKPPPSLCWACSFKTNPRILCWVNWKKHTQPKMNKNCLILFYLQA